MNISRKNCWRRKEIVMIDFLTYNLVIKIENWDSFVEFADRKRGTMLTIFYEVFTVHMSSFYYKVKAWQHNIFYGRALNS